MPLNAVGTSHHVNDDKTSNYFQINFSKIQKLTVFSSF